MTLGAYPYSPHAFSSVNKTIQLLEKENTVLGAYICQGKVDERLLEKHKNAPKTSHHYNTAARKLRREIAAFHPDKEDEDRAKTIFRNMVERDV